MHPLHLGVLLVSIRKPEPVLAVQGPHHLSRRPDHPVWLLCQARKQEEESNVWNEILWSSRAYSDLLFNVCVWLKSTLLTQCCATELRGGLLAALLSWCICAAWTSRPSWHELRIPVQPFIVIQETLKLSRTSRDRRCFCLSDDDIWYLLLVCVTTPTLATHFLYFFFLLM